MNIQDVEKAEIVLGEGQSVTRYFVGTPVITVETGVAIDNPYNGEKVCVVQVHGMADNTEDEVIGVINIHSFWPKEGTYCTHSYDCCGCWYANPLEATKVGSMWIVTQGYSQNV